MLFIDKKKKGAKTPEVRNKELDNTKSSRIPNIRRMFKINKNCSCEDEHKKKLQDVELKHKKAESRLKIFFLIMCGLMSLAGIFSKYFIFG